MTRNDEIKDKFRLDYLAFYDLNISSSNILKRPQKFKKQFPFGLDHGRPERKKSSLHARKFTPKFLGTAEA